MAGLLSIVEANRLTKLQRFVEAACLVPGENAVTNPRDIKALSTAARKFAEAGAYKEAAGVIDQLREAFKDSTWETGVNVRCDDVLQDWSFHKKIGA